MPSSILVTYVTRHGSTKQVSEAVGDALREAGLPVKVARVQDPMLLGDYGAVILGATLSVGRLPADFHHFLVQNRHVLSSMRPWFFVLPAGKAAQDFEAAREQAEKELARHSWLKPADIQVFGRPLHIRTTGFPLSFQHFPPTLRPQTIFAMDIRDREEIRAWAAGIARQLRSAA